VVRGVGARAASAAALAATAALAFAACGGGSGEPAATGSAAPGSAVDGAATTAPAPAPPGNAAPSAPPTGPSAFTQPGPYPVGTLEIDAPNGPITVWYPGQPGSEAGHTTATYDLRTYLPTSEQGKVPDAAATPFPMEAYTELPAAEPEGQPFPLVLFSHGFCGYRQQSSFLTTAIASWGFVVAAPEHTARDLTSCLNGTIGQGASTDVQDLRAAIPILEAENLKEDGTLATIVDTTRVAVVGHSAGGSAAIQMSGDPDVVTYIAMAAGSGPVPAATPGLYVAGDADVIAPAASIEQWWTTSVPSPRQLAVLGGVTHLGFMDLCTIAADQGGIFQVTQRFGVTIPDVIAHLTADGCSPSHTAATAAWPAIRHLTIAQLRSAFGIDPAPVALDASVADAYPGLTVRYQSA
jgi:dienelactone hydrolase